jgi:hypothetical protein
MNCIDYKIKYPETEYQLDQDKEWILLVSEGRSEKIRLHDYEKFYKVPGLYEEVLAALGYNHICTSAFVNAFNLLDDETWVAFNIKDRFLSEEDDSGFGQILGAMMDESLSVRQNKRYCHRLSLTGEPLHYNAIVGKKEKEMCPS